jgi:hypothetical protein
MKSYNRMLIPIVVIFVFAALTHSLTEVPDVHAISVTNHLL